LKISNTSFLAYLFLDGRHEAQSVQEDDLVYGLINSNLKSQQPRINNNATTSAERRHRRSSGQPRPGVVAMAVNGHVRRDNAKEDGGDDDDPTEAIRAMEAELDERRRIEALLKVCIS
jgi:hypothetical protein